MIKTRSRKLHVRAFRLSNHLLKDTLAPFLIIALLLTSLSFLIQALRIGHHLAHHQGWSLIGAFFLLTIPILVKWVIPWALFLSLALTLYRLSTQIEASQSLGIHPLHLMRSWLAFSILLAIALGANSQWITPWSKQKIKALVIKHGAQAILDQHRPGFFTQLPHATYYLKTSRFDQNTKTLSGQHFFFGPNRIDKNKTNQPIIFAKRATLSMDSHLNLEIKLFDGFSLTYRNGHLLKLDFQTLSLNQDLHAKIMKHFSFIFRHTSPSSFKILFEIAIQIALSLIWLMLFLSRMRFKRAFIAGIIALCVAQLIGFI